MHLTIITVYIVLIHMERESVSSLLYCISSSDHMLEDWWHQLQIQNKSFFRKYRLYRKPFHVVSERITNLIFTIGSILDLSVGVQLHTIELLDRFVFNNYYTYKTVIWKNSRLNKKEKIVKWKEAKRDMNEKLLLRILSCIQLASKFISNLKVLVPKDILRLLDNFGHKVRIQEILESEMVVFKELNFMVSVSSPLVYVEHLIYMIPDITNTEIFYSTCAHILAVTYIYHQTIYDSLYYIITSKKTCNEKERLDFLGVECDRIYLASAVILCAIYLHKDEFNMVLLRLGKITEIPLQDIEVLAAIITECVISKLFHVNTPHRRYVKREI